MDMSRLYELNWFHNVSYQISNFGICLKAAEETGFWTLNYIKYISLLLDHFLFVFFVHYECEGNVYLSTSRQDDMMDD